MVRSGVFCLAVILLIGVAVLGTAGPAAAGSTATRCDTHGCVHVHCNMTGDRCYRYADGQPAPTDQYLGHRALDASYGHPVCDNDGDRCYPSSGEHWDFREYYRRLGYRWNTAVQ